jgi:hypothetical protein
MQIKPSIVKAIEKERDRQHSKWNTTHRWGFGDCSSELVAPIVKVGVLTEECGEVARAVLECNQTDLRRELVQVAAVAIAWLEALEPK